MTYLQQRSSSQQAVIVGSVAILHAGLAWVLVTGLAAKWVPETYTPFTATNTPLDVPTPPPPKPKDDHTVIVRPPEGEAEQPLGLPFGDIFDQLPGLPPSSGDETSPADPVLPKPVAAEPVLARPANNPGDWASPDDYPSRPYRLGIEGVARFELTVGANGKPQACAITGSSGDSELDAATCRVVMQRARFEPARDSSGNKVAGRYAGAIRWRMPN